MKAQVTRTVASWAVLLSLSIANGVFAAPPYGSSPVQRTRSPNPQSSSPVFHDAESLTDYQDRQTIQKSRERAARFESLESYTKIAESHPEDSELVATAEKASNLHQDLLHNQYLLDQIAEVRRENAEHNQKSLDCFLEFAKEAALIAPFPVKMLNKAGAKELMRRGVSESSAKRLIEFADAGSDTYMTAKAETPEEALTNFPLVGKYFQALKALKALDRFGDQVDAYIDFRMEHADLFEMGQNRGAIWEKIRQQRNELDRLWAELDEEAPDVVITDPPKSTDDEPPMDGEIPSDETMQARYEKYGTPGLVVPDPEIAGVAEDSGSPAVVDLRDAGRMLESVEKQAGDVRQKMETQLSKADANRARVSAHFRPGGRPSASNDPKINLRARVTQGDSVDTRERDAKMRAILDEATQILHRAQRLVSAAAGGADVTPQANALLRDTENLAGRARELAR